MGLIRALGYLGFGVSDATAWKRFATGVLGVQVSEELADGTVVLRHDSYKRRVFLHPGKGDDILYAGWETTDAESLQAVRERLKSRGIAFVEGSPEVAKARAVLELIQFKDPDGNAVEAFYGAIEDKSHPFVSPVGAGPFVTGQQGLGHIALFCEAYAAMVKFYHEILEFKISDYCDLVVPGAPPGPAPHLTFTHVNPRHHSLALASVKGPGGKRLNHMMLQVTDLDHLGFAHDRALEAGAPIFLDYGRHTNDHMLSFYVITPSGWMLEYGWGGLEIDDEIWHVTHHTRPSHWGHRFNPPPAK